MESISEAKNSNINDKWDGVGEILIFSFIWCVGFLLAGIGVNLLSGLFDLPPLNELAKSENQAYNINNVKQVLIVSHLFQYLLPVLVYLYWRHPRNGLEVIYGQRKPQITNLLYAIGLVIVCYPFISFIYYWNTKLLPIEWVSKDILGLQSLFLEMKSPLDLFYNLLLFGIVAGLGEELFFRGIMQRLITKTSKNVHLGAIFTGFFFSLMHFQPEGFISRWILGVLFCYILVFSANIWITVIIHILFNSIQVIIPYIYPEMLGEVGNVKYISPIIALFSSILFIIVMHQFVRANQKETYLNVINIK